MLQAAHQSKERGIDVVAGYIEPHARPQTMALLDGLEQLPVNPHISPAAAEYQVARIAKANDMTEDEVREIIQNCTDGRFLGIFGEETVNVLEVNLMLDGILEG